MTKSAYLAAAGSSFSADANGNVTVAGTTTVTTVVATTANATTINSGLLQNGNSNVAVSTNGNVSISSNGLVWAIVDTSGRLQLPYHPCFRAYRPANANGTYNANATIIFNTTVFNVGSHFNTTTYQFTAPIAGLYLFSFIGFNNAGTSSDRRTNFYVNGSQTANYQTGLGVSSGANAGVCLVQILRLAANDAVDVRSASAGNVFYEALNHTEFSGYLIG